MNGSRQLQYEWKQMWLLCVNNFFFNLQSTTKQQRIISFMVSELHSAPKIPNTTITSSLKQHEKKLSFQSNPICKNSTNFCHIFLNLVLLQNHKIFGNYIAENG